ncbi:MAG: hypothetical protein GC204_18700 [Chloroflexi bacterium]|nr:hypothetical protein [Chloroflexota bacterium]
MAAAGQAREKAYQRYAWVILFLLSALLVLDIVIVAGVEDHASEFQKDTGVTWQEFTTAYPGVADAYVLNQRLLYVGFTSLALFGLVVTWVGFRHGDRWAWFAMWLLVAALALTALLFAPSRRPEIGAVYGGFGLVALIALLLPIRKFFPSSPDHEVQRNPSAQDVAA